MLPHIRKDRDAKTGPAWSMGATFQGVQLDQMEALSKEPWSRQGQLPAASRRCAARLQLPPPPAPPARHVPPPMQSAKPNMNEQYLSLDLDSYIFTLTLCSPFWRHYAGAKHPCRQCGSTCIWGTYNRCHAEGINDSFALSNQRAVNLHSGKTSLGTLR